MFNCLFFYAKESPKFVLGQGKSTQAYEILQKMNRMNNGNGSKFEQFEILEETESIENRQRILRNAQGRFPLLTSIWSQTVSLMEFGNILFGSALDVDMLRGYRYYFPLFH